MAERLVHPDSQNQSGGLVWEAFRRGKVWITRGQDGALFEFAAGALAQVKGDASRLKNSPKEHALVLGAMALHPCLAWADALVAVPNGMIEDAEQIAERLGKPVVRMYRPENATPRYDIRFVSNRIDRTLAAKIVTICALEDLSSTGSTPYEQAKILRHTNPSLIIHSLSMLQRAPIRPEYQQGPDAVGYHTLCVPEQSIPLNLDEFVAAFGFEPELVGADYS